ncbi:MAG TPA: amidohydrolase family protein [Burkholderiales bacterium]|nr:amidohydrolase family protein [Burkholderiales bacterium]
MASGIKSRFFSRRNFFKAAAAGTALTAGGPIGRAFAHDDDRDEFSCNGRADIALVNGRIHTMDRNNRIVSAVAIRDGRFAEIGRASEIGRCGQVINLHGASVIPGLIDSHCHFVRDGLNPGHEVRIIELAASVSELLGMIAQRARTVPAGQFITCVSGWNINGLAEHRVPTTAELDAAAPHNPIYISEFGGTNKALTNTSGKAWFTGKGVVVNADGSVASAGLAFAALRAAEIAGDPALPDRLTTTREAIAFANSLGLTMVHDVGGNGFPQANAAQASLFVDLTPYNQALELWREKQLNMRIRSFLYSEFDTSPTLDVARTRMINDFIRLGDNVFRLNGVGERVQISTTAPGFVDHCIYAATHGWTVQQHSATAQEIAFHVNAYQQGAAAAAPAGIGALRWSLTHANVITDGQIAALRDIKVGITAQGTAYTGNAGGTPFRSILDIMGPAGIPTGGGSDATNVGPLNPWLMMYFMSTGKNNAGVSINGPQSCTRLEALRMYTLGSAYFSFDDDKLGSIERGKLADCAVLSDDPLTASDDGFRRIMSTLTLQSGRIVSGGLHHRG